MTDDKEAYKVLAEELNHQMKQIEYVESFGVRINNTVNEYDHQEKEGLAEKLLKPKAPAIAPLLEELSEKWLTEYRGFGNRDKRV